VFLEVRASYVKRVESLWIYHLCEEVMNIVETAVSMNRSCTQQAVPFARENLLVLILSKTLTFSASFPEKCLHRERPHDAVSKRACGGAPVLLDTNRGEPPENSPV
jgi:hypothetical protein